METIGHDRECRMTPDLDPLPPWADRYSRPDLQPWSGRVDSVDDYDAFRWHQWIQPLDLPRATESFAGRLGIALLGFCSDEGIRRNLGRPGAVQGPRSIRKELSNLPCWFSDELKLFDAGDLHCADGDLEGAQAALAGAVARLLELGYFPVVLGGGHETAYGHFRGLRAHLGRAPAIVNFDAHFDMRPYPGGGTSGTMFRQIADDCAAAAEPYAYLCLGVQRYGNTVDLFRTADRLGVQYVLSKDLAGMPLARLQAILAAFAAGRDHLYVTICADVFSSAFAPGVSASQPLGMDPEQAFQALMGLFRTGKVRGFDVCEISPRFDQDNTTANLAKVLVFSAVRALAQVHGLSLGEDGAPISAAR